ncbi:MAG: glutamate racemase [bacterium]
MSSTGADPIGVFDSGLGGLTVLKELMRVLPNERIIYLGDTARVPYGNKSPQTVTRYSFEITRYLLRRGIKLLIIACNTASAYSMEAIQNSFSVPCLGVIKPGARAAVRHTRSGNVAVIGTSGTIASRAYPTAIADLTSGIVTHETACPLFVSLVEEGWVDNEVTEMVARIYLGPLSGKGIDTMILGCTHYPLLKGVISRVMGQEVRLVDSAEETTREAKAVLDAKGLLAPPAARGGYQIYVTDLPRQFTQVATLFLGEERVPVEQVNLDEFMYDVH